LVAQNYFVLHDDGSRAALEGKWYKWCAWPWQQPLDDIRGYFVRTALTSRTVAVAVLLLMCWHHGVIRGAMLCYWCECRVKRLPSTLHSLVRWRCALCATDTARQMCNCCELLCVAPGMYTMWLVFPALLGLALFIHQLSDEKVGVNWLPIYAIIIVVWVTFFCEYWKREQSFLAMKWGTSGVCSRCSDGPVPRVTHGNCCRTNGRRVQTSRGWRSAGRSTRRATRSCGSGRSCTASRSTGTHP
jgi:hypothetical protein